MTADPRKVSSPGTGVPPGVDAYTAAGSHVSSPSEKRLSLRSPRTALEPERMPEPGRPSRRARHPLVVAGSAIFTIILLATVAAVALTAVLSAAGTAVAQLTVVFDGLLVMTGTVSSSTVIVWVMLAVLPQASVA